MRTGRAAIVVNADEHDTAVAVGEAHNRVHQLVVGQRDVDFREEFGCELFSTRKQPAELFVGDHAMKLRRGRPPDDSRTVRTDDQNTNDQQPITLNS